MGVRFYREFSVFVLCVCALSSLASGFDTLTASQYIKDPDTLISENNKFTLGFFNPENSSNRYVGIWFMSKAAVVWVANRNEPLTDSSGIVKISKDGNLVILNGKEQVVWSSEVSNNNASHAVLQLLNTGNLVLRQDNSTQSAIWESFQHPSNTFLPDMKISTNAQTGEKIKLTSWKSPSHPATGSFFLTLEPRNVPELFIWHNNRPYWRSRPWNGQVFIGIPNMSNYASGISLVKESGTLYSMTFSSEGITDLIFTMLNSKGNTEEKYWDYNKNNWVVGSTVLNSECDIYGICGSFAICDSQKTPICSCMRAFEPRNAEEWINKNWTSGCMTSKPLKCERVKDGDEVIDEDGFVLLKNAKVPDVLEWFPWPEEHCRLQCLQNCSCIAYAYDDGIGCMLWSQDLIDTQRFSSTHGVDLYIRVASSELDKKRNFSLTITITVIIGTITIAACAYGYWTRCSKPKGERYSIADNKKIIGKLKELPLFDFQMLISATNNFHSENKLGQGGFGPVYKGRLQDGQEIAVKRLSSASEQGSEEFMTEVMVISKLQHRNLVRLLGCCLEGGEKLLIYEYMPNKSLDAYLFDPLKHNVLDWQKRFNIIEGIARGLLYLHKDSRLRIIHRDVKASNILLDEELNPKISDFGMAKIFGGSKDEAYTRRVVGTYGYMPPEYAIEGSFSEKSDVFSFGVLLLEIISSRKNTSFYDEQLSLSLLGFVWKLWNEGNVISSIDPKIYDPCFEKDLLKCIHIGLLCVQELAKDRPTMATVVSMLNSQILNLPAPRQPAFIQWQAAFATPSQNRHGLGSLCSVTITDIQGR